MVDKSENPNQCDSQIKIVGHVGPMFICLVISGLVKRLGPRISDKVLFPIRDVPRGPLRIA